MQSLIIVGQNHPYASATNCKRVRLPFINFGLPLGKLSHE